MTLGKKAKLVSFTTLDGSQQSVHPKQPHFLKNNFNSPHGARTPHGVFVSHLSSLTVIAFPCLSRRGPSLWL